MRVPKKPNLIPGKTKILPFRFNGRALTKDGHVFLFRHHPSDSGFRTRCATLATLLKCVWPAQCQTLRDRIGDERNGGSTEDRSPCNSASSMILKRMSRSTFHFHHAPMWSA